MTHQVKSYKKFVATAATATLVASAIAPVASAATSFTDVSDRYKEAVDYLVSNDITVGETATKFGTQSNLKRSDAAVWLAKALELDTTNAPESGFTDVPARAQGAVNALKAAGYVNGKTATSFGANDSLKRGEMALILAKAYDLKSDGATLKFTDVSSRYDDAVKALVANEITSGKSATKFGTDDLIKRGEMAIFMFKAEKPVTGEAEVVSVSATNSKTIEVKFNKAVSKDAALKVTRDGGAVVNVAETNYSEDRKSVELVLPNKFVAGDYTVALTDGETKSEKTVTLADEKVADIKISSDVAIANSNTTPNALTVAYQVFNQYGEDVTADYSVTPTSSQGTANITTNGVIDITGSTFTFDSNVTVTLLHAQSGTFASKTVKVSAAAKPSAFEMKGLYHADNKTPRAGDSTTGYSVLFQAKDQYGNALKAADLGTAGTDYVLNSSNTTVADLNTGSGSITDVKVDGKEYISVPLTSGNFGQGTTVFNLISTTSGKSVSSKLEVPAALAVSNITLGTPEFAVGGDKFNVPFTALDQDGKAVTDLALLNAVNFTVSNAPNIVTSGSGKQVVFKKNYVTGEIFLEVDASNENVTQNKTINIIATTQNGAVAQRAITLRANAYAASVAGLKNIEKNLVADDQVTLAPSNLVFKDQYGRDMKSAPSLGTTTGKYQIKVDTSNSSVVKVSNGTTKTIDGTTVTDVTLEAGSTKGSANITVTLLKVDAAGVAQTVSNSSYRFTSNVVEKLDIASLELDDFEVLNDGSTTAATGGNAGFTDFDLVVYGIDANGNKAVIPFGDVTVTSNVLAYDNTTGKLSVKASAAVPYASSTVNTADVNFIVSAHGKTVNAVAKVTREKAVLTTVTPDADAAIASNYKRLSNTSVSVDKGVVTNDAAVLSKVVNALTVEDQYGADVTHTFTTDDIVLSNFKDATGKTVANLAAANVPGGSYKVTILLPSGNSVTIDVIVAQ